MLQASCDVALAIVIGLTAADGKSSLGGPYSGNLPGAVASDVVRDVMASRKRLCCADGM